LREPHSRAHGRPAMVHLNQALSPIYGALAAIANLPGNPWELGVRASAIYTISSPSGSYDSFAPTCSTRRFQFFPR